MALPSIAHKIPLEETKEFTLDSALDAWLTSKNGKLGYRITEDRTIVFEDARGNTVIEGSLKTGGDLDVGGKIIFRNGLVVEGDTWLKNKLRVEEDITLDGDVYVHANLYVSKNFQLSQDGSIRGNLSVEDSITVNDLIVTGNAQINSILDVNNDINILGDASVGGQLFITNTTPATSSTTGAFQCDGGISVDEASWFGGDLLLEGGDLTLDHGGLVNAVINLHGSTEFLIRATATDTFQIRDKTAAANRMTIDASGDTTFSGNVSDDSGNVRNNIDTEFLKAYTTYYTEYTYTSGDLTQVDVWDSAGKTTKLFTKVLAYTTGNLTSVTLTDEVNSNTLTKTLTYDGSGNLDTLTRSYS